MKKYLVLSLICICGILTSLARAETIDISSFLISDIPGQSTTYKTRYSTTGTVNTTSVLVVRLDIPIVSGQVKEFGFESSFDNCSVWLSEGENDNETAIQTFLHFTDINLGFQPAFDPVYFYNRDDPSQRSIYMSIDNKAADNMSGWDLIITYGR